MKILLLFLISLSLIGCVSVTKRTESDGTSTVNMAAVLTDADAIILTEEGIEARGLKQSETARHWLRFLGLQAALGQVSPAVEEAGELVD